MAVLLIGIAAIVVLTLRRAPTSDSEVSTRTADIEISEEEAPPSRPLTTSNLDVMKKLSELEMLSYNELIGQLNLSREELNALLNDLRSKGYIEMSGEFLMLTDKGRKLLELMREKHDYLTT